MRFSIVAGALLGVFCVAEQSPVGTNATEVQELFAELTELPTCAVSNSLSAICDLHETR